MTFARINVLLVALLLIVLAVATTMSPDTSRPNWRLFKAMKQSPASQAFESNSQFGNQRTMQPFVPGTIPRGDLPLHFSPSKEDAVRAGAELLNPFRRTMPGASEQNASQNSTSGFDSSKKIVPTQDSGSVASTAAATTQSATLDPTTALRDSAARGGELYRVYCASCHGSSGMGDGPIAKRGFPPPPPLPMGKSVQMKDGQLFHILTYGQGSMPSMANQLSRNRRWDLVNFVRTLQPQYSSSLAPAAHGISDPTRETGPEASAITEKAIPRKSAATESKRSSDIRTDNP